MLTVYKAQDQKFLDQFISNTMNISRGLDSILKGRLNHLD